MTEVRKNAVTDVLPNTPTKLSLIRCLLYGKREKCNSSDVTSLDILLANGNEQNLNLQNIARPLLLFYIIRLFDTFINKYFWKKIVNSFLF